MSAESLPELDTLGIAKELEASGMPQAQAEAQARIYLRYLKAVMETRLVTKEDLHNELELIREQAQAAEKGLKEDIQAIDKKLERQIQAVDKKLERQIQAVEKSLSGEIQDLKMKMGTLESDLKNQNLSLTVRLGSIMVAGIGVFAILTKVM